VAEQRSFFSSNLYIIESVRQNDVTSGAILCNQLKADPDALPCELFTPSGKKELFDVLQRILDNTKQYNEAPIIHFCMHGDEVGLEMSNLDPVDWPELKTSLTEINTACRNNLFVTLAVCQGAYLLNIIHPKDRSPYWGMIGNVEGVHQGLSPIAFYEFYKELKATGQLAVAFDNLNEKHKQGIKTKLNPFSIINSELTFKKTYLHYKKNHANVAELELRAKKIMKVAKIGKRFPGMTKKQSIEKVKTDIIIKSEKDFLDMWRLFFMVDLYPDNEERFPMIYKL
jgi:hypothetical protein